MVSGDCATVTVKTVGAGAPAGTIGGAMAAIMRAKRLPSKKQRLPQGKSDLRFAKPFDLTLRESRQHSRKSTALRESRQHEKVDSNLLSTNPGRHPRIVLLCACLMPSRRARVTCDQRLRHAPRICVAFVGELHAARSRGTPTLPALGLLPSEKGNLTDDEKQPRRVP